MRSKRERKMDLLLMSSALLGGDELEDPPKDDLELVER